MTSFAILLVAIFTLNCYLAISTSIDSVLDFALGATPAQFDHSDITQVLERFVDPASPTSRLLSYCAGCRRVAGSLFSSAPRTAVQR